MSTGTRGDVRVALPAHLRNLAHLGPEVRVEVEQPVTTRRVLDALEADHPVLRGTVRDHGTHARRAFVRFYVGGEDLSHDDVDAPLPAGVASGDVPFRVVGAMAGG